MANGSEPVVVTTGGAVRGRRHAGVDAFLNIPYAAPPVGAGRFAQPEPHTPWRTVRDAGTGGPTAPQPARGMIGTLDMSPYFGPGWVAGADYLTASVWTPTERPGPLPIMVFVHGGGFVAGSTRAPLYEGSGLARRGVLLVTVNYRLGIPGFLDLPGAPPNRGMLDVLAAVGWVRDNAAVFGGDPDNVTLFGQSAGATVVAAALTAAGSTGLFQRAIIQSGTRVFNREQGERITASAADILGVTSNVAGFAALSDAQLVEATAGLRGLDLRTATHPDPLLGIAPIGVVLDQQPSDALSRGIGSQVDVLIGTNADEGNLYVVPVVATTTNAEVALLAERAHPDPAQLLDRLKAQRPAASPRALLAALMGDVVFEQSARSLAEAHASAHAKASTFVYRFGWRSSALGGLLGAAHTIELPFIFGSAGRPDLRGHHRLLGPAGPPPALASRMQQAWVGFASDGEPGWAAYDANARVKIFK